MPAGSASSTATLCPRLASSAARLSAVVVLPTPPLDCASPMIFAMSFNRQCPVTMVGRNCHDPVNATLLRRGMPDIKRLVELARKLGRSLSARAARLHLCPSGRATC